MSAGSRGGEGSGGVVMTTTDVTVKDVLKALVAERPVPVERRAARPVKVYDPGTGEVRREADTADVFARLLERERIRAEVRPGAVSRRASKVLSECRGCGLPFEDRARKGRSRYCPACIRPEEVSAKAADSTCDACARSFEDYAQNGRTRYCPPCIERAMVERCSSCAGDLGTSEEAVRRRVRLGDRSWVCHRCRLAANHAGKARALRLDPAVVRATVEECGGNKTEAARRLGCSMQSVTRALTGKR